MKMILAGISLVFILLASAFVPAGIVESSGVNFTQTTGPRVDGQVAGAVNGVGGMLLASSGYSNGHHGRGHGGYERARSCEANRVWVKGHHNRHGRWVRGHYREGRWIAGHYNRNGHWVRGYCG